MRIRALWAIAVVLLAPECARASDGWSTPYVGVRHLHRTNEDPLWSIHVVAVDLASPGVRLAATTYAQRKRTTSSFAELRGAQVAINGDFFTSNFATTGLAAGGGKRWPRSRDSARSGVLAFGRHRIELYPPPLAVRFDSSWMVGVVSGIRQVLEDGVVPDVPGTDAFCSTRHPRTAVGLSRDKKTLFLLVVDGRQPSLSVGMTCAELGAQFQSLGAWNALNLDGGGSTTMYLAGQGVVNSPSDGSERVVANHLAVLARPLGKIGTRGRAAPGGQARR